MNFLCGGKTGVPIHYCDFVTGPDDDRMGKIKSVLLHILRDLVQDTFLDRKEIFERRCGVDRDGRHQ